MKYLQMIAFVMLLLLLSITTVAQTTNDSIALHLREIPKHNLSIDLGIAQPLGDFGNIARSGLNVGIAYDTYFNKYVGISTAARHTYNETGFAMTRESKPQNEKLTSITAGVVGAITFDRFQIDGFARSGIGFLDTNDTNGNINFNTAISFLTPNSSQSTSAVIDLGLRFNYYFRRSVQMYFSPQYQSTIGNPLSYRRETLADIALIALFDPPVKYNYTNLNFNVGVKFAIGRTYTNGELRDDSDN